MNASGAQATEGIPGFAPFGSGEKTAAIALFLAALFSILVLSFVLLCAAWIVSSSVFNRTPNKALSREAFFIRSQLGQYAACLLLSNWIRAVSGMIDIDWIMDGGVKAGTSCIAQGSLKQTGQNASFFFLVAMGVHTFNSLVLGNRPPHWLGHVVTFTGWVSALVIGVAPVSVTSDDNGPFYYIGNLTCDISKSYGVAHMLLFFLPLFLASLLSALIYSLIFLMLRGTIVFNAGLKVRFNPDRRLRPRGNETVEEYQRFIHSVARTLIWLPISFVLALLPSSIIQLMEISGITVSTGIMAISCILERLDGVINVIILFSVLRALSSAMKPSYPTDSEKSGSGKDFISRPLNDTKSISTSPSKMQGRVTKSATPARLSDATPPKGVLSLFRSHKKTGSTSSSTHMLIREAPSRGHSPDSSLDVSAPSSSTLPFGGPASNIGLPVPPEATQKSSHLNIDMPSQLGLLDSAGLSPPPRDKRSRISRDRESISGPPILRTAPVLEVTVHSPTTPLEELISSSLINMYFSRDTTMSAELPPFPDTAVHRDSSTSLYRSITLPSGWPTARAPAQSAVDRPVSVPPEGIGSSLKASVSVGAVGGRPTHPRLRPFAPPVKLTSSLSKPPTGATESLHSDSGSDGPPSSEASAARDTKAGTQSGASREEQPSVHDHHPAPRVLPLSRSLLSHTQPVKVHKLPSSSTRYGYL